MFRRVGLFLLMNFAVMIIVSILASIFGLGHGQGGYAGLFGFCFLYGMVGAFISLQLTRWQAKKFMGVRLLAENSQNTTERWLVERVHAMAKEAGITTMPEVGIYDSPEANAFATGPSKNRSLIAVSSGLLHRMNRDQVEGVLAHEVAHAANGDMVTMALLQGVVNAVVMFLARVIALAINNAMRSRSNDGGGLGGITYFLVVMLLQSVLMIPGMMVIAAFSRWREFNADKGGAALAGKDKMRGALEALKRAVDIQDPVVAKVQNSVAAMKISSPGGRSWRMMFSTHPPLDERIRRLS